MVATLGVRQTYTLLVNTMYDVMKETYTVGNYVNIWHSDENGAQGELLMEAQIARRICVGKSLIARTVEREPKSTDLGVVECGREYKKRERVTVKTDKGWYLVANNGMEAIYGEPIEWDACFDD